LHQCQNKRGQFRARKAAPIGGLHYQARRRDKNYDGVAGQAYDRGAVAAMWLWWAQQRMKSAAK
jgi:hypothetical protein